MTMNKDLGDVIVEYFDFLTKQEQEELGQLLWELGRNINECGHEHHIGTSGTERENNPHTKSDHLFQGFLEKLAAGRQDTPA